MKDNISLIAAAAGGFMLSVALSGILRGTPVTGWQEQSSFSSYPVANLRVISNHR
ncbi:hypothetical protein Cylst_2764 [Cylindrospermum stagnale PCC 7417]|uniref:Uncharacterized protein n=1 Tax=Cylindrospermum stagnale PCC 7417 TaxID=56107 RepID=K9WYT6_9NOST|nr:hypothetical protein [Cylindrospermum stagnale]AFZ24961.1 hypothetical protein Cylst_2764 [Cylindrospermum stagnale PCC 7417]